MSANDMKAMVIPNSRTFWIFRALLEIVLCITVESLFFLDERVDFLKYLVERMPIGKAERQNFILILKSGCVADIHAGRQV